MSTSLRSDSFGAGLSAGLLLSAGAQALHWFGTPAAHPDATTARAVAVALQAVVGFGAGGWLAWRDRRGHRRARPAAAAG